MPINNDHRTAQEPLGFSSFYDAERAFKDGKILCCQSDFGSINLVRQIKGKTVRMLEGDLSSNHVLKYWVFDDFAEAVNFLRGEREAV